jgi:hypothetical protein
MDEAGFRQYLAEHKLEPEEIEQSLELMRKFDAFLSESGADSANPTKEDVEAFSISLQQAQLNSLENYYALIRYGRFIKNQTIAVGAIELVDGAEAFDNLYAKLGQQYGDALRDEIFQGIELPALGSPNASKPGITYLVMERLERVLGRENSKQLLKDCLRSLQDAYYLADRQKYLECRDLDEFLERKGNDYIIFLESLMDEGQLYFTQEITPEVIAYVESHPEIRQGVREGNILYETKIPCQTKQFLAETDEQQKRYAYCHCPWVRESLRSGRSDISPLFCNCSAGFHKRYWEVVLGQPLRAEVLETVLKGDERCRFAIDLSPVLAAQTDKLSV